MSGAHSLLGILFQKIGFTEQSMGAAGQSDQLTAVLPRIAEIGRVVRDRARADEERSVPSTAPMIAECSQVRRGVGLSWISYITRS